MKFKIIYLITFLFSAPFCSFAVSKHLNTYELNIKNTFTTVPSLHVLDDSASQVSIENKNNLSYPSHWNEPDHTSGLHIGGLFLGLFLPIAGIFVAKHIGGKAEKNRKKWALIGSLVTLGLILIAIISKSTKY